MRYKLLGPSGLRVSELALGTMSFGDAWGFGCDEKDAHRILARYADAGGNFIDTANKYHEGQSEEIVGKFVASQRDRWVLGTKYTLTMRAADVNAAGNSRKNLMASVEGSLRRLRTDCIDLLWVHAWDYVTPVDEVLRGLEALVQRGKVHYIGLSDSPAWVAAQANTLASFLGVSPFVALQLKYNLLDRSAERELLPVADALGLSVTAWAPLGAGLLSGKYTRHSKALTDSKRAAGNQALLTDRHLEIAREVDRVADELGKPSAQVAIAWLRQQSQRVIPIVGVRTVLQLEDAVRSIELELPPELLSRLERVSRIDMGFPFNLLASSQGQMVYGDLESRIDLPANVPYRRFTRLG